MLKKFFESGKTEVKVSRKDPDYRTPLPNFKGQRRDPLNMSGSLPASKATEEMRYRSGPIHGLHPRDIRAKSWLSMFAYVAWYGAVFAFIAYRLNSDDLDTLEKEARQQAELKKKIQKEFSDTLN
jgi:hypothetical protein